VSEGEGEGRQQGRDGEANRLTGRMRRYAKVGSGLGQVAARFAGNRLIGRDQDREEGAAALSAALGGLKGPLMKIAQLLATIPDALPSEYALELIKLQANAPAMGWPFVRRRMAAELGPAWQDRFASFEHEAAAAASLGQVHRAVAPDGTPLACKLQYPDMESAVEADLSQLQVILAVHRRMRPALETQQIALEIGERLREELDYIREAKHMRLYAAMLADQPAIHVPEPVAELSTRRLLTMNWLEGRPLLDFTGHDLEDRNRIASLLFNAWWRPFSRFGVIHGDPHLGNYTVRSNEAGAPEAINLLDYGCIRIFPPKLVQGVLDLYHGLQREDREQIVHAYESWGFEGLDNELIDILNIWARFIYGPLLEDRVRALAEGLSPAEYGRRQAFTVHKGLKQKGPVAVPRAFVFMDRAAIGLGAVFIHLRAELNFYRLFNETIENYSQAALSERQALALRAVGLEPDPVSGARDR